MAQMQKTPTAGTGKPESADTLAGNKLAEMEGKKADEAIKAASVILAKPPETVDSITDRLMKRLPEIRLEKNINGECGGRKLTDNLLSDEVGCSMSVRHTALKMASLIMKGQIDEETFAISEGQYIGQKICICLVPSCRIGPFIPIQGK